MKLPLMRLRISGGEPLFSTHDTLRNPTKSKIHDAGIDYWLQFFEELDTIIGDLKQRRLLHIIDKNDVKNKEWTGELPFPTCIAERHGRLNIRFDTNGIVFGHAERTDAFIGGLYRLFTRGKLQHVYIEIDYSFKGATPLEYDWSQRRGLPVDASRISFYYTNDEHPQIPGYQNITQAIDKYCSYNTRFTNGIGITVERGINHNLSHKTYVNCPESLNWHQFSDKTGIEFSVVDNPIEMFNWRNYQPKRAFITHGANITIVSDPDMFNLQQHPNMQAFNRFRQTHPNSHFIIYPMKEIITLEKRSPRKIPDTYQQTLTTSQSRAWTFSGTPTNWETALAKAKWGVRASSRDVWNRIQPNDTVLFYVTRPVSRLIGYAKVTQIVEEDSLLWPDEVQEQSVKYPLRIQLRDLNYLPRASWRRGLRPVGIEIRHGINFISLEQKWKELVENIRAKMTS